MFIDLGLASASNFPAASLPRLRTELAPYRSAAQLFAALTQSLSQEVMSMQQPERRCTGNEHKKIPFMRH